MWAPFPCKPIIVNKLYPWVSGSLCWFSAQDEMKSSSCCCSSHNIFILGPAVLILASQFLGSACCYYSYSIFIYDISVLETTIMGTSKIFHHSVNSWAILWASVVFCLRKFTGALIIDICIHQEMVVISIFSTQIRLIKVVYHVQISSKPVLYG